MQISVDRFIFIHKYIWNSVIEENKKLNKNYDWLVITKRKALKELLKNKVIDSDEYEKITLWYNDCILCAIYDSDCDMCPLDGCRYGSLFMKSFWGDEEAMKKIRDIVDREFLIGEIITWG